MENSSNLSFGVQDVCLQGQMGAIQSSLTFDEQGRVMGPEMNLVRNNSTLGPWKLAIDGSMSQISVENGSWPLPKDLQKVTMFYFTQMLVAPIARQVMSLHELIQIQTGLWRCQTLHHLD